MRVGKQDPLALQDFIAMRLKLSRRAAKEMIDARRVWVNRKCIWMARFSLKSGDVVETSTALPKPPVKYHVRVLWSNDNFLVCDKPSGMLSCDDAKSVESLLRNQEGMPELKAVHRLDRDTTGCLLFAKSHSAFEAAVELFKARKVEKTYHAVVAGRFPHPFQLIDSPIDNQPARTRVSREASGDAASFLRLRIDTGRTNQIRRHLSSIRFPIVGDRVFGLKNARDPRLMQVPRQMLHASTLALPDPFSPKNKISVHSPLPADFRGALKLFGMGK